MNSNTVIKLTIGSDTLNKLAAEIRMIVGLLLSGLDWEELKEIDEAIVANVGAEWTLQIIKCGELEVWMGGVDSPFRLCIASYDRVQGRLTSFDHATVAPHHVPFVHSELSDLADGMIARFPGVAKRVAPLLNAARYAELLSAQA